jgi:hypothetical protein
MSQLYAPNQQVVRADGSGPWDEGEGGGAGGAAPATATAESTSPELDLDAMTKDELLALAQSLGVTPANASMTKDEIRAGVDAHLGAA